MRNSIISHRPQREDYGLKEKNCTQSILISSACFTKATWPLLDLSYKMLSKINFNVIIKIFITEMQGDL